MKLHPALVGGLHPSEVPEIAEAAKRADAFTERTGEAQAVWIGPNSTTAFRVPDDTEHRIAGCVMVYSTADGWITIPEQD